MADRLTNDPQRVCIVHRQGSTQTMQLLFKLPDGNPEDITGRDYSLRVKKTVTSNDLIREFTISNGAIVITDGPNGVLDITIDDTADPMICGNWVYDFDEDDAGAIRPIMKGTFKVTGDV